MRYTFNTKRGKYSGEPEKCICFLFFGTKARFEPKARKSWLDKTDAYPLVYVSIWTASFDAVFGQRLRLPKNATAFFGFTACLQGLMPLLWRLPYYRRNSLFLCLSP